MAGRGMKDQSVYELNKTQQYIMQMRPVLHKRALFCDGTADYRKPMEPKANEMVEIRFRTAKDNVDAVLLWADGKEHPMQKVETENEYDYYAVKIQLGREKFQYYFEVITGMLHCYYDRYGATKEKSEHPFTIVPGFSTPDWAKGAVMYQILVDRFYNADPTNDVVDNEYFYIRMPSKKVETWEKCPENFSVDEFYGGDLAGVLEKMDYLEELGVEVIYFNPLFVSPSNHKYDIQDYDNIDPHYGKIVVDEGEVLPDDCHDNSKATKYISRVTDPRNLEASNELFRRVVEEAHRRGMKVILDGVFNHCGSFNKWMDREGLYTDRNIYEPGAYLSEDSPYRDYFAFTDERSWPKNTTYEGWWGYDTLPKLNYEGSETLYQYILKIAKKWVSAPYNADGWRLDVAADLGHSPEVNHKFWQDFRDAVKEANPNAIVLAEHYGDASAWLQGNEWDTIMNYDAFMEPLTWFLTGMEKHSDERREEKEGDIRLFEESMKRGMSTMMTPSILCSMNELSNHDHSRFLTRTNHKAGRAEGLGTQAAEDDINKGVFREAVVVQMTWPGAPTIYYGDEAGLCGFTDPDNRRTYPWGNEDKNLIEFHKAMIRIHKSSEAFRTGSVKLLSGGGNLLCFARFNREDQFIVAVNNDDLARHLGISVWGAGMPKNCELEQIMFTNEGGYSVVPVTYQVKNGHLNLTMQKRSAIVLRRKK